MTKLFISHSSQDDAFVRDLRQGLADLGQYGWIDSRELRGGDPLWSVIRQAIEDASAYAVVVSPDALQSKWVGKELSHALFVREQRGKDNYPVVPLSLDGTKLGVLEEFFGEEPIYIPVTSKAGGIDAALHTILVALGKRLPTDLSPTPQTQAEPLEDLVLELSDLKFHEHEGVRRASARARLVYEPATVGQREVASKQGWRLVAPIGPIEANELTWYLEKYAIWPSEFFRERARRVEESLVEWGKLLHEAALPVAPTANVLQAWAKVDAHAGRRFSVYIDADAALETGAPASAVHTAREAATLLLGLPWELLHDGEHYFFQGGKPTRVRRRLPNTRDLDVPVLATPIRILLISARPEDEACGYLDHRASALPLVEAIEALGSVVELQLLAAPTLPALGQELERAHRARKPYHVVHFDGHGVYDRSAGLFGLGGLCFEDPQDDARLEQRRHITVFTTELGPLLNNYRIPLVFLEACQTAQAEQASESVASELLKTGVASVVAMSHSVLVETARRFVQVFYAALAAGVRVGDAMLAGQRTLKDDSFRGRVFGIGELRLQDWFVPVLFQEKEDPQLFRSTPMAQTREDRRSALAARLGELPAAPETGFVGRSRELLALERLLRHERYAVIRGQGGEGKTALAAELARWLVRSQQVRRAAFVSVETHSTPTAVLDALGRQLVGKTYSAATFADREQAILRIERVLAEQSTLLVVDNMESLLLPPYLRDELPQALGEDARRELAAILELCARLTGKGQTRVVFTSREALPEPFAGQRQRRELAQLAREDAVKLVERVLDRAGGAPRPGERASASDTADEAIAALVDAVHCHARTLALLAPELQARGVRATHAALVELMAAMDQRFPTGHPQARERSVFASVELSLLRLSAASRDRARVLGVFHGGVQLVVLSEMMQWETHEIAALAGELVATGLAVVNPYAHLTLNPALCPWLRAQLQAPATARRGDQGGVAAAGEPGEARGVRGDAQLGAPGELDTLEARWVAAMRYYVDWLGRQQLQKTEVAATLTALDLPNLFALLDRVQRAGDAAATIDLATSLYRLLQMAGKPRLLERVAQVRDAAAALGEASEHASFEAERTRIEQQDAGGRVHEALAGAQALLECTRVAGEYAYPDADFDLAVACFLLARVLRTAGGSQQALPLLDEARRRFEAIAQARPGQGAERMASVSLTEQGNCLLVLGQLDEAEAVYGDAIRCDELRGDRRSIAVGQGQIGTVRLKQRRYAEALAAYAEARERFTRLDEPSTVALYWHQTGVAHQEAGQPEAAEDAYRQSLAIQVRLGNVAGQAKTLMELGRLYENALDRPEYALTMYRQVADRCVDHNDKAAEGNSRIGLANTLRKLGRLDEAREEIGRAIDCCSPFGHAVEPWRAWDILAQIERTAGNAGLASEAKQKAIAAYLAYRRDGGENHYTCGRICLTISQPLLTGDGAAATAQIQKVADNPQPPDWLRPFAAALQAIVAGSRDRRLADDPQLDCTMAAEILWLIEMLEQRGAQGEAPSW